MDKESPTRLMDQITLKSAELRNIIKDQSRSPEQRDAAKRELKRMNQHFSTRFHEVNGKKKEERSKA